MSQANPLVSIIIPAFNAEKYIASSIASAIGQTYAPIEVIVVDDGSTDRTGEIAKSFGDSIRYVRHDNKGLPAARNTGIVVSAGEYLAFLDADDLYLPGKIAWQVAFLNEHPEFDIAYCHMYHFYDGCPEALYRHGGPSYSGSVFAHLLQTFFGQADTLLVPRRVFDAVGPFDATYQYAEDWELNLRIARAGFSFGFIDEPLVKMRIAPGGWSGIGKQVQNKQFHVRLFESIAKEMTEEERITYGMSGLLVKAHVRLALAHLLEGNKSGALQSLCDAARCSSVIWKIRILSWGIRLTPARLLRWLARRAWKRHRRKLLMPV